MPRGQHNQQQSGWHVTTRVQLAAGPKNSSTAETQENYLKANFMNMTEILKEEINKSLKERKDSTNNWRKLINPLKIAKKNKKGE